MNAETNHCREVEPRRGASRRNLGTCVWHHNHKSTSNSIAMNRLYSTVRQVSVSFQSKRLRRSVEPRRDAGRRNLGTRVGHHNHKSTTNSIAMNRLYPTVRQASVSFQSKRLRRSVEPPEGAPAGGISALVKGIIAERFSPTNRAR